MSWGPCFMYYHCGDCGKKFKYAVDMIPVFGEQFGFCPDCNKEGVFEQDGARIPNDAEYIEIED